MTDNLYREGPDRLTYVGAPIHDGSPQADIRDALVAAHTHPIPAVREILVRNLSARLVTSA
jgi:hypothetical protein